MEVITRLVDCKMRSANRLASSTMPNIHSPQKLGNGKILVSEPFIAEQCTVC